MLDWATIVTFTAVALSLAYRFLTMGKKSVFDGASVVITGGSAGIGLALAKLIASSHSPKKIVLLARNPVVLNQAQTVVIAACSSKDTKVDVMTCDVSNDKECEVVGRKLGDVDILVNCAGISYPSELENLKVSEIQTMINTNLLGSIFLTRSVVPGMKTRKQGIIVFVASQAAQCGLYGYSVYSATKFALRGLAEALQMEVEPFNMSVCVSYPPDTNTDAYARENERKPEATKLMSEDGLMEPQKVAETIRDGIEMKNFTIWSNFDGFMLSQLTCGFSPANSVFNLVCQVFLMGIMRIVSAFYRFRFAGIVRKCMRKQ
jgi:3-dehydrosphinganine reductase